MIQDIAPLHLNNQYGSRQPAPSDCIFSFRENAVCVRKQCFEGAEGMPAGHGQKDLPGQSIFPTFAGVRDWCAARGRTMPAALFLFEIGTTSYFLADLPEEFAETDIAAGVQPTGSAESRAESGTDIAAPTGSAESRAESGTDIAAGVQPTGSAESRAESGTDIASGAHTDRAGCDREISYTYVRMSDVRRMRAKAQVLAAATAWHLYVWYRDNRFCGRCGGRLVHSETMRMLSCPSCGNQIFPKIAPAVIVGVTDKERILMTKYANREYKRYALIAGFTEIGETAEETVRREVYEEVGLRVKHIRYYKSQPWGFDSNLLLGYFCELDDMHEIRLDTEELATAEWVHYSEITDDEEGLSLTREMMTVFRDGFKNGKEP